MSAEEEIRNVAKVWLEAFVRKDAKACTATYTEDAWILSPYGVEAHGHEAIDRTHGGWMESAEKNKQINVLEVTVDGNLAYSLTAYSGDYVQ